MVQLPVAPSASRAPPASSPVPPAIDTSACAPSSTPRALVPPSSSTASAPAAASTVRLVSGSYRPTYMPPAASADGTQPSYSRPRSAYIPPNQSARASSTALNSGTPPANAPVYYAHPSMSFAPWSLAPRTSGPADAHRYARTSSAYPSRPLRPQPPGLVYGATPTPPTYPATPPYPLYGRHPASTAHTATNSGSAPPRIVNNSALHSAAPAASKPITPTRKSKLPGHDCDLGPIDTTVEVKKPLHLFDLPTELVKDIFELAYPQEDLTKFVIQNIWDEKEMELKRMNIDHELRPLPPRKVCDFLVSKKFFECATAAWVGNQDFVHHTCRLAGSTPSGRTIFDYLGYHQHRITLVERLCQRLTTRYSWAFMLSRLPNLSRLTLLIEAVCFKVLEPHFAWEFVLTDDELQKIVASSNGIEKLHGLVHFEITPGEIKYARTERQKNLWKNNVKALEAMLRHIVLAPLSLRRLYPETAVTAEKAVVAKPQLEKASVHNDTQRQTQRPVTTQTGVPTAASPQHVQDLPLRRKHSLISRGTDYRPMAKRRRLRDLSSRTVQAPSGPLAHQQANRDACKKLKLIEEPVRSAALPQQVAGVGKVTTNATQLRSQQDNSWSHPAPKSTIPDVTKPVVNAAEIALSAEDMQLLRLASILTTAYLTSIKSPFRLRFTDSQVSAQSKYLGAIDFGKLVMNGKVFDFSANAAQIHPPLSNNSHARMSHLVQIPLGTQSEGEADFHLSADSQTLQPARRFSVQHAGKQSPVSPRQMASERRDLQEDLQIASNRVMGTYKPTATFARNKPDETRPSQADYGGEVLPLIESTQGQAGVVAQGLNGPSPTPTNRSNRGATLAISADPPKNTGQQALKGRTASLALSRDDTEGSVDVEDKPTPLSMSCHPDQWVSQPKKKKKRPQA